MTLQRLLDIALTVSCLLIAALLIEQRTAGTSASAPAPSGLPERGQAMPVLPGVNFGDAARTLVIVTRSSCPYCEQSAAFWQRLVDERDSKQSRVRIVAVSAEPIAVTQGFLQRHGLRVDNIVSTTLPIRGTPTLVLVDAKGLVTNGWAGKPPPSAEEQIIEAVLM